MAKLCWLMTVIFGLLFVGCGRPTPEENGNGNGKLPDVPKVGASDGKLDERDGENQIITKDNIDEFVREVLLSMLGDDDYDAKWNSWGERYEDIEEWEKEHNGWTEYYYRSKEWGAAEGYRDMAGWDAQYNDYGKGTFIAKYFNYSDNNKIFFGGGVGAAFCDFDIDELKINGEIKFNGLFKGSIVYRNYHVKQEMVRRNGEFVWETAELGGEVVIKSGNNEFKFNGYWFDEWGDDVVISLIQAF